MIKSAYKLANFGYNNEAQSRGCLFCDHDLREETLISVDLYICDCCGRVWQHGDRGLLCEIGTLTNRREL